MNLEHAIDSLGGLASTAELYARGASRAELRWALENSRILRVRQGWYSRIRLADELLAAARVGGRLTCAPALKTLGVWVPTDGMLHVAVHRNSCQLRSPGDKTQRLGSTEPVRVHWDDDRSTRRQSSRLQVAPVAALHDLAQCVSHDTLLASADSLLHRRADLRRSWNSLIDSFPRRAALELATLDGVCESGTETLFWIRMRRLLPDLRRQIRITGVGRVDFLVGDTLVIEVDGAAYHTDPARLESDRRRDALLSQLGFRVLRFSYHQVMSEWASVEAAVLAAVARGDHR